MVWSDTVDFQLLRPALRDLRPRPMATPRDDRHADRPVAGQPGGGRRHLRAAANAGGKADIRENQDMGFMYGRPRGPRRPCVRADVAGHARITPAPSQARGLALRCVNGARQSMTRGRDVAATAPKSAATRPMAPVSRCRFLGTPSPLTSPAMVVVVPSGGHSAPARRHDRSKGYSDEAEGPGCQRHQVLASIADRSTPSPWASVNERPGRRRGDGAVAGGTEDEAVGRRRRRGRRPGQASRSAHSPPGVAGDLVSTGGAVG